MFQSSVEVSSFFKVLRVGGSDCDSSDDSDERLTGPDTDKVEMERSSGVRLIDVGISSSAAGVSVVES